MPAEPLDELIELLESSPADESRQKIYEAVRSLLDFHRAAFARVVAILRERGQDRLLQELRADPLLESVLQGYGLLERAEPIPLPVLPPPDPMGRKWLPLVHASEVPSKGLVKVSAFEHEILLCATGGQIFAVSALCPAEGSLEPAVLEGTVLTCSCHGLRFDLRTGRASEAPGLMLQKFPVRREDDLIKVAF